MSQGDGTVSANNWGSLEPRVRHLEMEVGDIKDGQRMMNGKLDTIVQSLATQSAMTIANKPIQLPYLLDIATKGIILVAAFTTVVVYLARNGQSDELHKIDSRLLTIEQRIAKPAEPVTSWSTTVTKR